MKKYLNKQQIFTAANKLASTGNIPTLSKVREHLGTGSKGTIHKYFNEWKKECFKNFSNLNKVVAIDQNNLLEEHRALKLDLQKQATQNECYAQELITAEKANVTLKEEINQLQVFNQELQPRSAKAEASNLVLEQVIQKIQMELNLNTNHTIQKMQQTIDDLRVELKTLNEASLTALRETSNKGHETLMQEKVTIVNLQAKVDNLNKELLESKKQLNEALIVNQVQTRALSRQIEWQQKVIQEHIAIDCLQHQKKELDLQTATTMERTYGK